MIITLISDFGYKDSFVGIMKGVIAGINPQAHIIDLSHGIAPQDVRGAALLLRHSIEYFPRGTVHVVVVDPGVGSARRAILVESAGYFLVGPDNGVLSLAYKDNAELRVTHLSNTVYHRPTLSHTFHGRDVFAPVAAHLSLGADPASFGNAVDDFSRLVLPSVTVRPNAIEGEIVYIDGFGNLFTNIGAQELQRFAYDKIAFTVRGVVIQGLATHYAAAERGGLVALINSWGILEIALNQGNAQQRCAARIGDKIEARVP
ncbi:MAG TPA: SAM-dependent chlorinase/fluorinase [Candidatus Binatia bacterium]|nr:SAM-dependent chlorinase/fluorinase [Candidatus Binatia bacterium]